MIHTLRKVTLSLMLLTGISVLNAARFASMSLNEVSALLAQTEIAKAESSAPAKGAEVEADAGAAPETVILTADDLMTKVYGVISPEVTKSECADSARRILCLDPESDGDALWVEAQNGYRVSYDGMSPEVAAMAGFEGEKLNDFCFFFMFPQKAGGAGEVTHPEFCGSLLQEINDLGAEMGENVMSEDLFEVCGEYRGNFVDIRLLDDSASEDGPRYILMLSVEPGGFTPADSLAAL